MKQSDWFQVPSSSSFVIDDKKIVKNDVIVVYAW
jgi:hypothetical protein